MPRPLVLESRKYLAATYLFLGRKSDAEGQLELLLRAEPDYVLDPLAFPAEFVKTFSEVKVRLEQERLRKEQERARAAAQERGQGPARRRGAPAANTPVDRAGGHRAGRRAELALDRANTLRGRPISK